MTIAEPIIQNALLDRMQYRADPLADATIAAILGAHTQRSAADADPPPIAPAWQSRSQTLTTVSRVFEQWPDNRSLVDWSPHAAAVARTGCAMPAGRIRVRRSVAR